MKAFTFITTFWFVLNITPYEQRKEAALAWNVRGSEEWLPMIFIVPDIAAVQDSIFG